MQTYGSDDSGGAGRDAPEFSATGTTNAGRRRCRSAEATVTALATALSGRTFREIGERTGCHPETVRRYLSGGSRLPVDFFAACCVEFDLDPDQLLIETSPRYVSIRIREDVVGDFERALGRNILESLREGEDPFPVIISRAVSGAMDKASQT